jgi:V-type H+-transporting ATPase subunit a
MGFFRSEEILHKKLRLPREIDSAVKILNEFGLLSEDCLQFIDLTKTDLEQKKNFNPMINRCENLEQIIDKIEQICEEFRIKNNKYKNILDFENDLKTDQDLREVRNSDYFDILENELIEKNKKIQEIINSYNKLKEDLNIDIEKKEVYKKYLNLIKEQKLINENEINMDPDERQSLNNVSYIHFQSKLLFIIGVVDAVNELKMKRMIFRVSRATAYVNFSDININVEKLINNNKKSFKISKKIFIIFYPSDGREILRNKLIKICDLFHTSIYQPQGNDEEIENIVNEIEQDIKDKNNIIKYTKNQIIDQLFELSGDEKKKGKISLYKLYFKKMKEIYLNLNKCIIRENFIDGEVWIIKKNYNLLKNKLNEINEGLSSIGIFIDLHEANLEKPTYLLNNSFFNSFQDVVNSYGIPRYQEINPGYFNIIFFPFLFGIMFGDIGHGLILLLIGLYIYYYSEKIKQSKNSMLKMGIQYQYFIIFMGFCSFYSGFMYNDFIGNPIPIFNSCYNNINNKNNTIVNRKNNCVYPIGIDSKWYSSTNELSFINSLKMKLSVIYGVFQMIFGIILKGLNDLHFKDYISFILMFIPQLIFMSFLFGYMIILIYIKWNKNWDDTSKAPSIISQMINIILRFGSIEEKPLWGKKINKSNTYQQEQFHKSILIICLISSFIMLVPKPILIYYLNKKKERENLLLVNKIPKEIDNEYEDIHYSYLHKSKLLKKNPSITDLIVNQIIETIEFILGTISNTASYLRLWALSLAHSQLSKVFFEYCILIFIRNGDFKFGFSFILIVLSFFIFANITIGVLMFMDLMECFLHTLRLHWVEFQNKFFYADGYLFHTFSFNELIDNEIPNINE